MTITIESEVLRLSQEKSILLKLYQGKCIHCFSPIVSLHHIRPRSRGRKSEPIENQVPICQELHDQLHNGNPDDWIERLEKMKQKALHILYD